jgi:tetratricopeptide (TPR) repeat protein
MKKFISLSILLLLVAQSNISFAEQGFNTGYIKGKHYSYKSTHAIKSEIINERVRVYGKEYTALNLNNEGVTLLNAHNIQLSIKKFNQGITLLADNPNYSKAVSHLYNNRAVAFHKAGKTPQEENDYLKSIKFDPKNSKTYNNLGLLYLQQDKNLKAVDYFIKTITLSPKNHEYHQNLANAYADIAKKSIELGDLEQTQLYCDKAIASYKTALNLNPNDYHICDSLADVFYKSGNYEAAKYYYNIAKSKNPLNTQQYNDILANINEIQKGTQSNNLNSLNNDNSLTESVFSVTPVSFAQTNNKVGEDYLNSGDVDLAINYFLKASEQSNNDNIYTKLGLAYGLRANKNSNIEDLNKAINALTKALSLNPNNNEAKSLLMLLKSEIK